MCGILGYTHVSRDLPAGVLEAGLRGLVHRGPDQQRCFKTRNVSLGATRLRVVDLQGGAQPMHGPDRDCTILFNGEASNHGELRTGLEGLGWRFRSPRDPKMVPTPFLTLGQESF